MQSSFFTFSKASDTTFLSINFIDSDIYRYLYKYEWSLYLLKPEVKLTQTQKLLRLIQD